ncbi:hypothetical protein HDU92_006125 [Lobulomyces angularis]|nr:hypothetical protein HDU92_006125 [Lobulomyces angularis]
MEAKEVKIVNKLKRSKEVLDLERNDEIVDLTATSSDEVEIINIKKKKKKNNLLTLLDNLDYLRAKPDLVKSVLQNSQKKKIVIKEDKKKRLILNCFLCKVKNNEVDYYFSSVSGKIYCIGCKIKLENSNAGEPLERLYI